MKQGPIDYLILIDRQVDLVSPLLTPLTYEGLIDEMFSIKSGVVRVPAEKFRINRGNLEDNDGDDDDEQGQIKTIPLNSKVNKSEIQ